jgi:outer membrane protein OmpA-like peptidoglycan-associated protein
MRNIIILTTICFVFQGLNAQNINIKNLYDAKSYMKVIEASTQVQNPSKIEAYYIGNAFYFNSMYREANLWYSKLKDTIFYSDADLYARISNSCKTVNDKSGLAQSEKAYAVLKKKNIVESVSQHDFAYKLTKIEKLNSESSDYAPRLKGNEVYYSSTRDFKSSKNTKDQWTNQNFSNLMVAKLGKYLNFETVSEFIGLGDNLYNEATPCFTKDGKTVFFTRNNINKGKVNSDKEKNVLLKIYRAKVVDGKWNSVEDLSINSNDFSCAHPALSADEKTLYFTSDRAGGAGQSDIYKVEINEDGTLGTPTNLGSQINSDARETQPFIDSKGNLYFASDRIQGFGGLDIYMSEFNNSSNVFGSPKNLGQSINSNMDDMGYTESEDSKFGFFSSNRSQLSGDDIYLFNKIEMSPIQVVLDANISLNNIQLTAMDINQNKLELNSIAIEGDKIFVSKQVKFIRFSKQGSFDTLVNVLASNGTISLIPNKKEATYTTIKTLYFKNKSENIEDKMKLDLKDVVDIMIRDEMKKLLIKSHSDSRGDQSSNMKLTENRAQAIKNHLVSNGIDASKVEIQALGDSQLVNHCKKGVNCSEKQHRQNSRVEIVMF